MKIARVHPLPCTTIFLVVLASLGLALPALGEESYRFVMRWGEGVLKQPIDIAVDSEGYAYVTEGPGGGRSIKKFRADGSGFLWESNMVPVPMHYPQGVAVDASGYVYVTTCVQSRVCVFRKDTGDPLGWFGACSDPSHTGSGHWHALSSEHAPQPGIGPGQFAPDMSDVDVDSMGRVYVSDGGSHRVQILEARTDGGFSLAYLGWFGGCGQLGQHNGNDRMHLPNSDHQPVPGDGNGYLQDMMSIAAAHAGYVHIADFPGSHNLQLFTRDGAFMRDWHVPVLDPGLWNFNCDADGNIFVSDTAACLIHKYSPEMTELCSWGSRGTDQGQMQFPAGLDIDRRGYVYVTDGHMPSPCVHVFAPANRPPVAVCRDVEKAADENCQAVVWPQEVDNGSYDPDGDAITLSLSPSGPYPLGETMVTLTVTDPSGASAQCTAKITVVDQTPPEIISLSASPNTLWPVNHKMVAVEVEARAKDTCDSSPTCRIVDVRCNEPVNGPGDGNTQPDWEITGLLTVKLRAERSGSKDGRIYMIDVECRDAAGNWVIETVDVTVPHDQGKKK